MDLGPQEWRDALFLRCGFEPLDLTTYCDGFQTKFSISHALACKKGGLVTARHNELRDGVVDLVGAAGCSLVLGLFAPAGMAFVLFTALPEYMRGSSRTW